MFLIQLVNALIDIVDLIAKHLSHLVDLFFRALLDTLFKRLHVPNVGRIGGTEQFSDCAQVSDFPVTCDENRAVRCLIDCGRLEAQFDAAQYFTFWRIDLNKSCRLGLLCFL